ncbi:MAG: PilZ domain-containing protein [Lachnospiraceae bacterium]|nr:PilZ domain-containing protein [Lachnospiraceae bacterium]
MEERRKNKRTSMDSKLMIKRLDGESHTEIDIEVTDVSKTGVGFVADQPLQIGEVYEAYLTIWTKEVLHAFLQIVRIELKGAEYSYGAVFIGMPEMDASRIEVYQTVNEEDS